MDEVIDMLFTNFVHCNFRSLAPPTVTNGNDSGFGMMPSGIGDSIPPTTTTSLSMSNELQPLVGCIVLVASIATSKLVLEF